MPFLQYLTDSQLEQLALEHIVPALLERGFFCLDHFLGEAIGRIVLCQVQQIHRSGVLSDGQLAGRGSGVCRSHIRGDKIVWRSGSERGSEAIGFLLKQTDKLISLCTGRLGRNTVRERSKVSETRLHYSFGRSFNPKRFTSEGQVDHRADLESWDFISWFLSHQQFNHGATTTPHTSYTIHDFYFAQFSNSNKNVSHKNYTSFIIGSHQLYTF